MAGLPQAITPSGKARALWRLCLSAAVALVVAACGGGGEPEVARAALYPNETPELRRQILVEASRNDVPVSLVQRVILRESGHRPRARNGPYYGLMQIHPQTAATMGHDGPAEALLDPGANLRYGVKYLRGAWLVSGGNQEKAVNWYARGYYYEAKRKGLLEETGLR